MYVKYLTYKRCSVAVSLLNSSLNSVVCKPQEGRNFCLFWSLLYPQSPQQWLAHSRYSINKWMILYKLAIQHRIHTRLLNIILNLLNWIVVLIRAISIPPGNSTFININYLWRPHCVYDYVNNCQSTANWVCPGCYPIPFCESFSGKTHLSSPVRLKWQLLPCTAACAYLMEGRALVTASIASFHVPGSLWLSAPITVLTTHMMCRGPLPGFPFNSTLLFHDILYHTTPIPVSLPLWLAP